MLSIMKLANESVGVVIANDGQGIVTIDDFAQLDKESVEGLYRVLQRPGGTAGGVSNTGVAVLAMAEANLQGIIYYIKKFKRIGCTCTITDVDLSKVHTMYHQRNMEKYHKDPEVVPTFNSSDWPNTLETVEKYIREFCGVDGKPLRYGLRDDLIAPVAANDPTYRDNGSKYFTNDEEMIARGLIISGSAVIRTDPEDISLFTNFFITERALIWNNMVELFQGSDAWM